MRKLVVSLLNVFFVLAPFAPQASPQRRPSPAALKESSPADASVKLPVRRVVLYKTGVGYFEHIGHVRGSQDIAIDFTSDQLNDVLKSLTILDLNGGQITGVSYNSEAPLDRRLGALRLPMGDQVSSSELLRALRGARIEARSGTASVAGRLLSVERKTRATGADAREVDYLTLVTDEGVLRGVELGPGVTVRLTEREVSQDVSRYLALLASARQQDIRRMSVSTSGTGERQLYVSYISEVPVWKTTYRLVLPSKPGAKPLLQGWAIVDNTVGEDWTNVQLSLVAGAPQSFIQRLSQPYYTRRPVVGLPQSAQLSPQTHESALIASYGRLTGQVKDPRGATVPVTRVQVLDENGGVVAESSTDSEGNYSFDSLPTGNYRLAFDKSGFNKAVFQNLEMAPGMDNRQDVTLSVGAVAQTITVAAANEFSLSTNNATVGATIGRMLGSGRQLGSGRGVGSGEGEGAGVGYGMGGGVGNGSAGGVAGSALGDARLALQPASLGQDLGDLFEYKLKQPVTIHKNQSALVPIIQTEIAAEKVSLWSPFFSSARPRRALSITNTSSLTLDGGSFNVLEDESFAGEGILDPLKPGEKRMLTYASDLGVRVESRSEGEPQRVTRVRVAHGVMTHTSELRERKTYTLRNDDTSARTLILEHPLRPGWKLAANAVQPEESTAAMYRFRVTVESKKTATLLVDEVKPVDTRYEISNLDDGQITLLAVQRAINPEVEKALRRILEQKARVSELESQANEREEEMTKIFDDQQRIRENLKALKGSAEEKALTERYTRQLAAQESRLEVLRNEKADFEKKQAQAQSELDVMIQQLSLDVAL